MSPLYSAQLQMRKTRFVCISDTHNQTPKLPRGDVLIHAGDLTNQGSISELQKTVAWLEAADFEAKIVIAGNHDITLDSKFYEQYGHSFHNKHSQSPEACQKLFVESSSITYLKHEPAAVYLRSPTGPHTHFAVFGSPYSPILMNWAFQYSETESAKLWDQIPVDTDIVITHTPPKHHLDTTGRGHSSGCEALTKALWRVRPRLVVCGHIHESRGAERVRWKLDSPRGEVLEEGIKAWTDPGAGNNKQSLVDLTVRGRNPLDNDGARTRHDPSQSRSGDQPQVPQPDAVDLMLLSEGVRSSLTGSRKMAVLQGSPEDPQELPIKAEGLLSDMPDVEAFEGRMGRKETCIINAAIMAASWGGGPKRFNKPIVVDIDLPVWTATTERVILNDVEAVDRKSVV